ncbi:MAG: addiction module protein [Akkermansiaceae bacterium]|nr:addiction module protein [Akkermansiaceae bacterium]MCP5551475.1 addiction module protein [Akkermansiaceae bacterium]
MDNDRIDREQRRIKNNRDPPRRGWGRMLSLKEKTLEARSTGAYSHEMTTQEIKDLPIDQKFQIMEAIWEDLRERIERIEIPQQYKDLLDERRARVASGEARLLDWDSVKSTIGRP